MVPPLPSTPARIDGSATPLGRVGLLARRILPLLLLPLLFYFFDLSAVLEILSHSEPVSIIVGYLVFEAALLMRSWRWSDITRRLRVSTRTPGALATFRIGWFAGAFLPQGLGPLVKVFYLRNQGHPVSTSTAGVLLERLLDLVAMLFFGLLGTTYLALAPGRRTQLSMSSELVLTVGVIVVAGLVCGFLLKSPGRVVQRLCDFLASRFRGPRLRQALHDLSAAAGELNRRAVVSLLLTTAVIWMTHLASTLFLLHAMRHHVALDWAAAAFCLASVALLLPISIDGVGVREASLASVFIAVGLPGETAVAWGVLVSLVSLTSRLAGAFLMLKYPVPV